MFREFNQWKAYSTSALFAELAEGGQHRSGGNKGVAVTVCGERHVRTNKAINVPAGMKGVKIRVPDAPLTIVGAPTGNPRSDGDRTIFEAGLKKSAARAMAEIVEIDKKRAAQIEKRGRTLVRVGRTPFREAVTKLHNGPDATRDRAT